MDPDPSIFIINLQDYIFHVKIQRIVTQNFDPDLEPHEYALVWLNGSGSVLMFKAGSLDPDWDPRNCSYRLPDL
jgi:hypothetical protein